MYECINFEAARRYEAVAKLRRERVEQWQKRNTRLTGLVIAAILLGPVVAATILTVNANQFRHRDVIDRINVPRHI